MKTNKENDVFLLKEFIKQRWDDKSHLTKEDIELEKKKEELEGSKQDRMERKRYALYIFWLLAAFLFVTLSIVVLSGVCVLALSEAVIITLLATTTADVIGIFIFVVRYLFNNANGKL
ncbi:MAG: hypothetical protein LBT94_08865 [Prevotellaceae bacterium]|jgi:uncharacterized membrane protein|nr:hypothetical protein [Prevotellaceae bacterium]